jgi:uncharacterized protein
MPRPKLKRIITDPPIVDGFKPFGHPITNIEPVVLFYEEYEAIKLCDYEGLTQEKAALRMKVSRPTLTRIYTKARQTIAEALVEGKAIFIQGGDFHTDNYWYKCSGCNKVSVHSSHVSKCCFCSSGNLTCLNRLQP